MLVGAPHWHQSRGVANRRKGRGQLLPKISGPQDCQQGCQQKERKGGQPVQHSERGSSTNYSRPRMGVAPTLTPGPLGHWHQFATISNKQINISYRGRHYATFVFYSLEEERCGLAEVDLLEQGAALQAARLLLALLQSQISQTQQNASTTRHHCVWKTFQYFLFATSCLIFHFHLLP